MDLQEVHLQHHCYSVLQKTLPLEYQHPTELGRSVNRIIQLKDTIQWLNLRKKFV